MVNDPLAARIAVVDDPFAAGEADIQLNLAGSAGEFFPPSLHDELGQRGCLADARNQIRLTHPDVELDQFEKAARKVSAV
jgi:hypothetical protein